MDVVGGVIVAPHHNDDRAYRSRRGMKRDRCCGDDDEGSSAAAMVALSDEPPGSQQRGRLKKSGKDVDLHEDYELCSVLSLYRPSPVLSLPLPRHLVKPGVVAPRARSWVEPLRLLLKKELTVTDVGDLGRIILPKEILVFFSKELTVTDIGDLGCIILLKRDAECQLPHLDSKEGKLLHMEDYDSNKNWTLRYKWWPNNKSRMYVLENTGEFVKYNELKEKDELIVYMDCWGKLVIRGRKYSSPTLKTDSFLGSPLGLKVLTPTGKRSPKGRSNLSKTSTSSLNSNTTEALMTMTIGNTMTSTLSMLTSLVSTTNSYSANMEPASNDIVSMGALVGSSIVGSYIVEGSPIIDWEKLPDSSSIEFSDPLAIELNDPHAIEFRDPPAIEFRDPPAIELSDPSAIEFLGEFECTWGDCI